MRRRDIKFNSRFPQTPQHNTVAAAKTARRKGVLVNKRSRGSQNVQLPFIPPEDWHEPTGAGDGYKVIVQQPGDGFRHILTPTDIRNPIRPMQKPCPLMAIRSSLPASAGNPTESPRPA